MELLLSLLGLGGVGLLLQSKSLPSKEDALKASDKLALKPDDSEANKTVGLYLAFVLGKYSEAWPYLVKSSNSTLKKLAEHESDPNYTVSAAGQVKMGNEWVQGASQFQSLAPIFYDRAASWYAQAWPNLKGPDKNKLRIQAQRLVAPRRPGPPRKNLPSGWINDPGVGVVKSTELDNTVARTGSYSAKMFPTKEDVQNGYSGLHTVRYPVKGSDCEASVFVRSSETDNQEDEMSLKFYDDQGTNIWHRKEYLPVDMPFWKYIRIKATPPPNAKEAVIFVHQYSKSGNIWVDDVSLKFNLMEELKNGSFEEK